jgi:uncharacterized protein YerC
MPHVSKKLLEKNKYLEINKQLYKNIDSLVRNGKTTLVVNELLTKTEKLMLSKRLAIIVLIDKGETIYAIENSLKVSPSTVARISKNYEAGEFDQLLKELRSYEGLWYQLSKIVPPKVGRDRFKNFLKF